MQTLMHDAGKLCSGRRRPSRSYRSSRAGRSCPSSTAAHYAQGNSILVILSLSQLLCVLVGSSEHLMGMTGRQVAVFKVAVLSTATSLLLAWFLTPTFGLAGAAISAGFSSILFKLLLAFLARKDLGVSTFLPPTHCVGNVEACHNRRRPQSNDRRSKIELPPGILIVPTPKTAIITGADENYFWLLAGLIQSLRRINPQCDCDLVVLDFGLSSGQVSRLKEEWEVTVVAPGCVVDVPPKFGLPRYFAFSLRCALPRVVPGYDVYLWMDSDTWVQDDSFIHAFVASAQKGKLAIVPESEPAYHTTLELIGWNLKNQVRGFGIADGIRVFFLRRRSITACLRRSATILSGALASWRYPGVGKAGEQGRDGSAFPQGSDSARRD